MTHSHSETNKTLRYTGIGGRRAPQEAWAIARTIGEYLAERGYILRTGDAPGMDYSFLCGAACTFGKREVYYARRKEYTTAEWAAAEAIASRLHPAWENTTPGQRVPLTRNPFQVTGLSLNEPSEFVVFWAPERDGIVQGGTRIAVHYARELGIPTFNLLLGTEAFKAYLREAMHADA